MLEIHFVESLVQRFAERIVGGQLGSRAAFAVEGVNAVVLRENAEQLHAEFIDLLADAVRENTAGGTVYEELCLLGAELQLFRELKNASGRLNAAAGSVG